MRLKGNQSGFSIVEIVIVLAVVGFTGLLGYTAYNRIHDSKTASNQATVQPATASDVKSAPAIKSVSDLDSAQATLDQTNLGASSTTDANELDNEMSAF